MKARNKQTGKIVDYIKLYDSTYTVSKNMMVNSNTNECHTKNLKEAEFNELYDIIHQTDLGVNDDTSKKDDILDETWRVRLNNSMINLEKYISITDFIGDFFQQELDRICEEVKSKEKCQLDHDENPEYSKGYDQAIDDIINIINK